MSKRLKIVADENMPLIGDLFGNFADIVLLPGRKVKRSDLVDADALLCRSITQVDELLLTDTKVQFVGTATIGTDHLDKDYLDNQNIRWANAAGCNAQAVVQYVMSAIAFWSLKNERDLKNVKVGIVGAGNVGTGLSELLTQLGIDFILCDPPLKRQGDPRVFHSLRDIQQCDVISLHVPLNQTGKDSTYHLVEQSFLASLTARQLLINAARGAVIDNLALSRYLSKPDSAQVVLDVFENEPRVNYKLLQQCLLVTPHIAGHTLEGKSRGSFMVYEALCQHFGLAATQTFESLLPDANDLVFAAHDLRINILNIYNIVQDCDKLRQADEESLAKIFDQLRKKHVEQSRDYYQSDSIQRVSKIRRDYSGWLFKNMKLTDSTLLKV